MARFCYSLPLLLVTSFAYASPQVKLIGAYSNQQSSSSDEPHTYGYSVTLYQEGTAIFGQFCWATGMEVPCAPIQDAKLDQRGKLHFRVKISIGTEFSPATSSEGRPARNLVEFAGRLGQQGLAGKLTKRNGYEPNAPADTEWVKLKPVQPMTTPPKSHSDWQVEPANSPANW